MINYERISQTKLQQLLNEQDGKIFTIKYYTKAGKYRVLTGRLGVRKYLRGGKNTTVKYDNSYITVFDMRIKQYRTVDLLTAFWVVANKTIYSVKY